MLQVHRYSLVFVMPLLSCFFQTLPSGRRLRSIRTSTYSNTLSPCTSFYYIFIVYCLLFALCLCYCTMFILFHFISFYLF
uniref:Uncharacterized protein n=1 Tax=Anguilla anguilla TaxID=7936 RepID=A0A0E9XYG2_ANGAN